MIILHALFLEEDRPDFESLGIDIDIEADTVFKEVYINPVYITSMYVGSLGTSITLMNEEFTVEETPEEILSMYANG